VLDKDARHKGKKDATTHYKTIAQLELPHCVDRYPTARYSVLSVTPTTGRRHQIRLHMKHISHPIIGDSSYGKTKHNRFFAERYQCERLLLHAQSLTFNHPVNGTECKISALQHDASLRRVLSELTLQHHRASTNFRPEFIAAVHCNQLALRPDWGW